jgi:hypothetical protein
MKFALLAQKKRAEKCVPYKSLCFDIDISAIST